MRAGWNICCAPITHAMKILVKRSDTANAGYKCLKWMDDPDYCQAGPRFAHMYTVQCRAPLQRVRKVQQYYSTRQLWNQNFILPTLGATKLCEHLSNPVYSHCSPSIDSRDVVKKSHSLFNPRSKSYEPNAQVRQLIISLVWWYARLGSWVPDIPGRGPEAERSCLLLLTLADANQGVEESRGG